MGWKSWLPAIAAGAAAPFTGGASLGLVGALGTAGKVAASVAPILAQGAASRAAGKQTQAVQQISQDMLRQQLYDVMTRNLMNQNDLTGRMYQTQTGNALNQDALRQRGYEQGSQNILNRAQLGAHQAEFELNAPTTRFGQAMKGNLAANMQDVQAHIPGRYAASMVNYTGGMRPSAIGEGGRAAGRQLAALAAAKMGHDTFALPEFGTAPTPTALSSAPTFTGMPAPPNLSELPQSDWLDKLLSGGAIGGGLLGAVFSGGINNNEPTIGRLPSQPQSGPRPTSPPLNTLPIPGGPVQIPRGSGNFDIQDLLQQLPTIKPYRPGLF